MLVYDNGEHLNFYMEGPDELVRELVIEFDAQDSNGVVVSDTSFVADLAINPPAWATEAQNGNTVNASEFPPPTAKSGQLVGLTAQEGSGECLGVHITSSITTLQEFERISIWIYKGFEDGRYSYVQYLQLYELLLNSASDGVIVGRFSIEVAGRGATTSHLVQNRRLTVGRPTCKTDPSMRANNTSAKQLWWWPTP